MTFADHNDHDLLQRIDERVGITLRQITDLRMEVRANQLAITSLRIDAAKWGAIAGMISTLLVGTIGIAVQALFLS